MYELISIFENVRDFMERGGPVLLWIFLSTAVLWTLIIERMLYYSAGRRIDMYKVMTLWDARHERKSWYARKIRTAMISQISLNLNANLAHIRALTTLCLLLGILGTVIGMVEMFDTMAILGMDNMRAIASGVAKITIPVMAGMVVSLSGLFAISFLRRRAEKELVMLEDRLALDH